MRPAARCRGPLLQNCAPGCRRRSLLSCSKKSSCGQVDSAVVESRFENCAVESEESVHWTAQLASKLDCFALIRDSSHSKLMSHPKHDFSSSI